MELSEIKHLFEEHAPCEKGREQFLACRTRVQVFNLVASPYAYDYVMRSISEGWGPSTLEFARTFKPYINGKRTVYYSTPEKKIPIQVWCNTDRVEIDSDVRWVMLIGCSGHIEIPEWQTVKLIVDKNTNVLVDAAQSSLVYVENYGGKVMDINGNCRIRNKINGNG